MRNNADVTCPGCGAEIELTNLPRWTSETECPACRVALVAEFDFIVLSDGDEWDLYDVKLANTES